MSRRSSLSRPSGAARRLFLGLLAGIVLIANLLAVVGSAARDRTVVLGLMLYLSMLPIGVPAVMLGLRWRRRSCPWRGGLALGLGLLNLAILVTTMVGWGADPSNGDRGGGASIRLLHWNVMWGGLALRSLTPCKPIADAIVDAAPDLVVLSEAPFTPRLYDELKRLPGRRFQLSFINGGSGGHFFHIYISSRWPLRLERRCAFPGGGGAVVVVNHPSRPMRLFVLDGGNGLTRLRTPMLHAIAAICDPAHQPDAARPIDMIVGDFNAVGRSIGFDELRQGSGGYRLASESSLGWRGTWPSSLPLLDIDHVWIRSGWRILGCWMFTSFASDHRGQVVELVPPSA